MPAPLDAGIGKNGCGSVILAEIEPLAAHPEDQDLGGRRIVILVLSCLAAGPSDVDDLCVRREADLPAVLFGMEAEVGLFVVDLETFIEEAGLFQ